jgi:hypothetical protein
MSMMADADVNDGKRGWQGYKIVTNSSRSQCCCMNYEQRPLGFAVKHKFIIPHQSYTGVPFNKIETMYTTSRQR